MKKTYAYLLASLLLLCGSQLYGQSLKNLLNKENLKEAVGSVVQQLDVIPKNISGNWEYTGVAVKFTGDNVLMNAASDLAASQIEDKLDEYLQKIGLKQGAFGYTFSTDSTFTTTFNKMKFQGKYTFSSEENFIELDYGRNDKLKGIVLKTQVSVGLSYMELLFNADKLLDFIGKISSTSGDSKLGILNSLVNQYDGMKIGFELSRKTE